MADELIIEQMNIADKQAVLAFLEKAYADDLRHSDPDFWEWHFMNLPYFDDGSLPIWLAKSGGRIAGQIAALPVEMNINDQKIRALWALDLIVDTDFRRMGISKKLISAMEGFCPYLIGVNTEQQHAPKALRGLGWVVVRRIPRYHKILFAGEAFRELSKNSVLRSAANAASAPFRRSRSNANGEIRVLDSFDDSFDKLWQKARPQWNCSISREAKMLDWQFRRQPKKAFDIIGYYEQNELLGYAVLFFRKKNKFDAIAKAAISDICFQPDNAQKIVDALLNAAIKVCVERRAGGLVADATDKLLQERLRRFGFWKVDSPLQLMSKMPEHQDVVYDPESWFLTRADSDISIFEDPNI